MEDILRIVLYFQLFQSLHNFFSLGALWEDSIFGQFLIDVVGPCLYDVIRVWILCTNYRTNPVSDKKKNAFPKKIERFPKTYSESQNSSKGLCNNYQEGVCVWGGGGGGGLKN